LSSAKQENIAARYVRQVDLSEIGEQGQLRLGKSRVLVAGCGALGSNSAELFVRAGIGEIVIVDSDRVELSNLQRQALVTEDDVGEAKAEAVASHLAGINSETTIRPLSRWIDSSNVEELIEGMDVVIDGLDNLNTRYVVNDACVKHRIPWIYAAVAGTYGMTMPILPGAGPCLRCFSPEPAPEGTVETAGTEGILNTLPRTIAAIQVSQAIRIVVGAGINTVQLTTIDMWEMLSFAQEIPRNSGCKCCGLREYEFLENGAASE